MSQANSTIYLTSTRLEPRQEYPAFQHMYIFNIIKWVYQDFPRKQQADCSDLQCIVLATRPLLFIFLQSRLGQSEANLMRWLQSEGVRGLLQVCADSSRQILHIVSRLLNQGLLGTPNSLIRLFMPRDAKLETESFLSFDLDATSTAAIAILMMAAIDKPRVPDHAQWSQRAYTILEEMSSHGSPTAEMTGTELRRLDDYLQSFAARHGEPAPAREDDRARGEEQVEPAAVTAASGVGTDFEGVFDLNCELSTEQLMQLADSLDMDSLAWPTPSVED